jgi:ECF sigma factor
MAQKARMLMTTHSRKDVTALLVDWSEGDQEALNELMPLVYDELHRLASRYLRRERADHTLQTTALVHEAYLKLVDQSDANLRNRLQIVFTSKSIENILAGFRARETYKILGPDEFTEVFEVAEPGKVFEVYSEGHFKCKK